MAAEAFLLIETAMGQNKEVAALEQVNKQPLPLDKGRKIKPVRPGHC